VRLQGIVGEATIIPTPSTNDSVTVSGFSFYKDNGTVVTVTTGALELTRDATKAQWHMIKTNASGTLAVVAGTVSADTSFTETWDGAGGPGYVATTDILIGAIKLTPGSAGAVLSSEIVYSLPVAGTLLQERSDVPGYQILPMEGGVLVNDAAGLLGCHTAGVTRTFYATYYDQYSVLIKVGDTEGWTLSGSTDTIEMEAQGDLAAQSDISGAVKWSGTLSRFYISDDIIFKMAMNRRTAILRLYPNADETTKYFEGAAVISDWGFDNSVGNACKENVSFTGDGNLELRGM
jgi:hypothetical protein